MTGNTARKDETAALGYASELFCSVQGEGIYVGERQVFFRTSGCAATCYWCDTVASKARRPYCVVHGRERRRLTNPITVAQALEETLALVDEFGPVGSVSITGGEPLEQAPFVAELAESLRAEGLRIYLETSGLEVEGLDRVKGLVDVVAMDIKLPYATGIVHWDAHRRFLAALDGVETFVKIVVDAVTPLREIEDAVELIASIDSSRPLVLQPESSTYLQLRRGEEGRARLERLLSAGQEAALRQLEDVRVIPQVHKILKVR